MDVSKIFIANTWRGEHWYDVPTAVLLGILLYSNTTGIIPAAKAMMEDRKKNVSLKKLAQSGSLNQIKNELKYRHSIKPTKE